jgi:hypothetical protein
MKWRQHKPQSEVGPQTRTFDGIKIVKEDHSVLFRKEGSREKTSVPAVRVATFVVELSRWTELGVVDLLDFETVR